MFEYIKSTDLESVLYSSCTKSGDFAQRVLYLFLPKVSLAFEYKKHRT